MVATEARKEEWDYAKPFEDHTRAKVVAYHWECLEIYSISW
jgi:hypothetical protein